MNILRQLEIEHMKTSVPDFGIGDTVDIGAYDTCVFGCAYCYATNSRDVAARKKREHDPHDTLVWRPPRLHE